VCAEQEGDYAISVKNRGFDTQITVEFDGILKNSACTFCGQCIQTCPTGALGDLKALAHADVPGETETTRTICPYCGVGCTVDVMTRGDEVVGILPAMDGGCRIGGGGRGPRATLPAYGDRVIPPTDEAEP
jgi:NADH dehydrogenase/NADH:ubiquinone oxidoreductase subunit G